MGPPVTTVYISGQLMALQCVITLTRHSPTACVCVRVSVKDGEREGFYMMQIYALWHRDTSSAQFTNSSVKIHLHAKPVTDKLYMITRMWSRTHMEKWHLHFRLMVPSRAVLHSAGYVNMFAGVHPPVTDRVSPHPGTDDRLVLNNCTHTNKREICTYMRTHTHTHI